MIQEFVINGMISVKGKYLTLDDFADFLQGLLAQHGASFGGDIHVHSTNEMNEVRVRVTDGKS